MRSGCVWACAAIASVTALNMLGQAAQIVPESVPASLAPDRRLPSDTRVQSCTTVPTRRV